jgi:hypothetical protein
MWLALLAVSALDPLFVRFALAVTVDDRLAVCAFMVAALREENKSFLKLFGS